MSFPILTILALLPLVGGAIVLGVKGRSGRATGLVISIVTAVLGVIAFIAAANGTDVSENYHWILSLIHI